MYDIYHACSKLIGMAPQPTSYTEMLASFTFNSLYRFIPQIPLPPRLQRMMHCDLCRTKLISFSALSSYSKSYF
jgi:hypothetical protein